MLPDRTAIAHDAVLSSSPHAVAVLLENSAQSTSFELAVLSTGDFYYVMTTNFQH